MMHVAGDLKSWQAERACPSSFHHHCRALSQPHTLVETKWPHLPSRSCITTHQVAAHARSHPRFDSSLVTPSVHLLYQLRLALSRPVHTGIVDAKSMHAPISVQPESHERDGPDRGYCWRHRVGRSAAALALAAHTGPATLDMRLARLLTVSRIRLTCRPRSNPCRPS